MNRKNLISTKIQNTIDHMLWEKSIGIKTQYTMLIDKVYNLYKDMYNKLNDKNILINIDSKTICDNALKYKSDIQNSIKKLKLGIDMDVIQNKINYYCFKILSYVKIDRIRDSI